MSTSLLVTGATGTIGKELVKALDARGARYSVMSSKPGPGHVFGDFSDPASLREAFAGVQTLFLLFPLAPDSLELAANAVDAAKAAGVRHIVRSSGAGAQEGSAVSIADLQGRIDALIQASGIAWTLLRPNGFMQNLVNYDGPTIRSQGAIYSSAADGRISHVDVRDIAAVAVAAMTQPGHEKKAYTLTGPEALTYDQIAAKIGAAAGRDVKHVALTPEQHKDGMLGAGVPEPYADALLDLNRAYRENLLSGVSSAVKDVTGRDPISFDQFAADNAAAFR